MRSPTKLAAFLSAIALSACPGNAPSARTQCGSAHIGPEGGSVTSASGVSAVFPPGSLGRGGDVSLCVVEVGRVPRQHSDVIELGPVGATLFSPVQVSVPVDATTPPSVAVEVRDSPSGPLAESLPVELMPGAGLLISFTLDRFGSFRVMEGNPSFDGGGPVDAGSGVDVNRPDAPRPVGPVVVGPDLTPADYACLGMVTDPPAGAPMPVTLHVTDWADHSPRAGYTMRAAPTMITDPGGACAGTTDCVEGTTSASGDVTLMIDSGPVFLTTSPMTMGTDLAHTAVLQWIDGRTLAAGATTLEVEALSQRTQNAIVMSVGFGGTFVLGTVRDCSGAAVQRVRVRVFDATSGVEILNSPLGGRPVTYGNGLGFPAGSSDRTTIDGVYLTFPTGPTLLRIEAWGHLTLDGSDVLLSCETVPVPGSLVLLDLRPLPAGAPSACGSAP